MKMYASFYYFYFTLQEIVKREVAYKISTYGKILTNSSPASHTSESGAFS